MSFLEIWERMRIMTALEAQHDARALNAATLGARGSKQAVAKRYSELGMSKDA